jgi:hypothetical protein
MLNLFTLEPEVNRFGAYGLGREDFELWAGFEVNSSSATTLENNEKILPRERRRTSCVGRLAEERGLGSNSLWAVSH